MHTPSVLSFVVVLLATSISLASDICTYASTNCGGLYGCCSNIPSNACCSWSSNYGQSVRFQNMPGSWFGRVYSDSACQKQAAGIAPLKNVPICSSVTSKAWLSASWGLGGGGFRRRDTEGHDDILNCVRPNVIGFTTEDGKQHLVKVPEGTAFDELNEWVKTENFVKLLELDSVSGEA